MPCEGKRGEMDRDTLGRKGPCIFPVDPAHIGRSGIVWHLRRGLSRSGFFVQHHMEPKAARPMVQLTLTDFRSARRAISRSLARMCLTRV